jgi:hypothetical protein
VQAENANLRWQETLIRLPYGKWEMVKMRVFVVGENIT